MIKRIGMLFSCWLLLVSTGIAADRGRPNFIIFIADDMAWNDCGAYGHKTIRTPHIDALAVQGIRFDNALLTCSSCSPSRASILTGRYPHNTGAEQLHWPLPGEQVTFAEKLKAAGYFTASAGKWHLGSAARAKFDVVKEGRKRVWQQAIKDRPTDKPFFLWLAFFDPHRGYQPGAIPRPHQPDDVVVPPYLPDVDATRRDLALYYDEIARLDGVVGEVLEELKRQGEEKNTFVLFISDNGRPFPRAKTTLLDSGIKTPFIVRYPPLVKPGSTSQAVVSVVDIAPTILTLAGVEPPETFEGKSFTLLLDGAAGAKIRDFAFAEHHWHDMTAEERAVRGDRYKYIRNFYPDLPRTPPADAVRSPTYIAMRGLRDQEKLTGAQRECFVKPRPAEELYDIQQDPFELTNLAGEAAHAKTLAAMRQALARWQQETGDALPRRRTPDEFDRETGRPLDVPKLRQARPDLRAGKQAD